MATATPYRVISKGPKAGVPLAKVCEVTGLKYATARNHVLNLVDEGRVAIVGQVSTGKRGRPAFLFGKAV